MSFDRSRVIIGFRPYFCDLDVLGTFTSAEDRALGELTNPRYTQLPGLRRVLRRLKYLNAVLTEIDPAEYDNFQDVIRGHDSVEYCNPNYLLRTADFSDDVASQYKVGLPSGRILRAHHISPMASINSLGVGIRIALLDSGISPHPFLPALSSSELRRKLSTIHLSFTPNDRDRLCDLLARVETSCGGVIGTIDQQRRANRQGPKTAYDQPDLADEARKAAERFAEDSWTAWEFDLKQWISSGRMDLRPSIPCYSRIFGSARVVSPLSRSFLEGELSATLADVNGHGTQMAGLISALAPRFDSGNPLASPVRHEQSGLFELDMMGVAPYAELLVLKCCHDANSEDSHGLNGCMLNLIDALAYLLDHGADVAYIGFAIEGCDPRTVSAVAGLLAQLAQNGCVIVAPVGNDAGQSGLAFPASASSVRAIAALSTDPAQPELVRAAYSPVADRTYRERVAFAAFGGACDGNLVITTSMDCGSKAISGSSVSAAIAAGIFGAEISSQYMRAYMSEYDAFIGKTGQIAIPQTRGHLAAWKFPRIQPSDVEDVLKLRAAPCMDSREPDADIKVGAGVIRI